MTAPMSVSTQQGSFTPLDNPVPGRFTPLTPDQIRGVIPAVDSSTGSPMGLRIAVGAASTDAQRLNTIRDWQKTHGITPDAKPTGDGNFVYSTNGGPMILFRPTKNQGLADKVIGWEADHLSDIAGVIGQAAAQTRGSLMVAPLGPLGMIGGGLAGGAIGGTVAHDVAQRAIGAMAGTAPDQRNIFQRAGDIPGQLGENALGSGTAMATGTLMGGVLRAMQGLGNTGGAVNMGAGAADVNTGINAGAGIPQGTTPVNPIASPSGLAQTAQRLQNFQDVGVSPSWAMASQTPFMKQVEAALSADPLTKGTAGLPLRGSGMMGAYAQAALQGDNATQGIVGTLSGTPIGAGKYATAQQALTDATRLGATQAIKDFSTTESQMSAIIQDMTQQAKPMMPVNTVGYFQRLVDTDPNLPNTQPFGKDPAVQRVTNVLRDAQQQGGLSFSQLLNLRTTTDGIITKAGGFGNSDMAYTPQALQNLEGLRSSLKDDLYEQASKIDQQNGFKPDPAQPIGPITSALKDHDAYVSAWHASNENLSFGTFKDMQDKYGAITPDGLLNGGDPKLGRTLLEIRKAFPPDQYNALASVWFANMGKDVSSANPDAWNPQLFTKRWNQSAPYRKNMFLGTTADQAAPMIDKLVQAAGDMSSATPDFGKSGPSLGLRVLAPLIGGAVGGTAEHLLSGGSLMTAGTASTLGAIGLPWLASKAVTSPLAASTATALLNSPIFLKAILPIANGIGEGSRAAAGMSFPMASRLWAIGKDDPKLKAPIDDYMQTLQSNGVQIPNPQIFDRLSGSPGVSYQPH